MTTVSDNEAANAAAPDADPQTIEPAPTEPAADDAADQASDYSHGDPIRVFLYDIPNDGGEWTARYEQGITRIRAKKVSPGVYLDLLHRVFPKHEVLVKGELLSVKNRPHPDDPKVLTEVTLLVYLATEVALFKAFSAWAGGDWRPIRSHPTSSTTWPARSTTTSTASTCSSSAS